MKKLLLFLALAAAGLQGWADDKYPDALYAIGSATTAGDEGWTLEESAILTKIADKKYQGFVKFTTGRETHFLKFLCQQNWGNLWGALSDGDCINSITSPVSLYYNGSDDKKFTTDTSVFTNNSIFLVTVDLTTEGSETVTFEQWTLSNFYEISSLTKLKIFANCVNRVEPSLKGKLTADIIMGESDKNSLDPIGTTSKPYSGTFDGQSHTINLAIDRSADKQALFGVITGGANIHDVTVTGYVTGNNEVAGIVGYTQGSGDITLSKVINNANIYSNRNENGTNAAGLVGFADGSVTINVTNCANLNRTNTNGGYAHSAAFIGWIADGVTATFTNCWNGGPIEEMDETNNLCRYSTASVYFGNCFDVSGGSCGQGTSLDTKAKTSGELCYKLNGTAPQTVVWYQTIGTDEYPKPSSNSKQVNQVVANWSYSNLTVSGSSVQISTGADLLQFSREVNIGNSAMDAELKNDIDMSGISYTPIGTSDHKYSGQFDGGGYRIKNLTISTSTKEQGLFSVCTGGATIKNLIMDSSCSITSTNSSEEGWGNAAFVAVCNGTGTLTFENCGNEATVTGAKGNLAAFVGKNYNGGDGDLTISISNCYNTGNISGGDYNAAFIGDCQYSNHDNPYHITNCYNTGTISGSNTDKWARQGASTSTVGNCYTTQTCGVIEGLTTEYASSKVESGELCYLLNGSSCYDVAWTQTKGTDAYPIPFNTHGIVNKISSVGYTTQYIPTTDVTIPAGVEAYAGEINGDRLRLVEIEDAISKNDAVVLKGTANTYYSFVPTTDVSSASSNDLKGSDGSVEGDGSSIYALANLGDPAVVGFYLVNDGVTVPAGKAYLVGDIPGDGPSGVKGFTFVFEDDADGINSLTPALSEGEGVVYNLAGQRIQKMQRGINIVNGKKILR